MHYLAPLRCLAQNPNSEPKSLWHYLAQMPMPLSNIFWHQPQTSALNPEILRHQTIGRHSIQAEANVQDPLSTPADQQVYYTLVITPMIE